MGWSKPLEVGVPYFKTRPIQFRGVISCMTMQFLGEREEVTEGLAMANTQNDCCCSLFQSALSFSARPFLQYLVTCHPQTV